MNRHRTTTRSAVFTVPVILTAVLLLVLGGVLAPLALVTQANTATKASAMQQVVPTPSVVPPGVEPAPTEEPTPTPSPTPDSNSIIRLNPDTATTIPIETGSDDVIQVDDDPDNVIGVEYSPSPTPALAEPTPFPAEEEEEAESTESSVRMVVRWCPFGTELGGPRIDHPLIEKLCTLDGPDIRFDLVPVTEFDKPRNAEATRPFPSTIDFTTVKSGRWQLEPKLQQTKWIPALFCRMVEPGSQFQEVLPPRTQDPVFQLDIEDASAYECHWYFMLLEDMPHDQPEKKGSEEPTGNERESGKVVAVEVTTYQCNGTPPRGADFGWFNKNCAAASGPTLELDSGEKDGIVPLSSSRSPVGYAVNKEVPPDSYVLTEAGGSPLKIHAVWCATLKPDQMPTPSDYMPVPISRAGVSVTVQEESWTSCKVFGPATRGNLEHNNHLSAATILLNR